MRLGRNDSLIERSSFVVLLLLGFAIVFLGAVAKESFVVGGKRYYSLADDAMISMRYAYNLADGRGLVWNAGDRVEGYTNLGWTLIMALVHEMQLPLRFNALVIQLANLLINLGLLVYVFAQVRSRTSKLAALFATVIAATNVPILIWGLGGTESTFQVLLVTVAVLRFVPMPNEGGLFLLGNRLALAPILCAIAFVVRPDSIVFLAVAILAVAWLCFRRQVNPAAAMLSTLVAGLVVVAVLYFQHSYYGDWLPNTFYLKATGGAQTLRRGIEYFFKFAFVDRQLPLLLGSVGYVAWGLSANQSRGIFVPVTLLIGAWFSYILWVGGDAFQSSRFFIPIIPVLGVITALLIHQLFLARRQLALATTQALTFKQMRFQFVIIALILGSWLDYLIWVVADVQISHWFFPLIPVFSVATTLLLTRILEKHLIAIVSSGRVAVGWRNHLPSVVEYIFGASLLVLLIIQAQLFLQVVINDQPDGSARQGVMNANALNASNLPWDITIGVFYAGVTPYFMPDYRFHDFLGKSDVHIASSPAHPGPPGHNKWDMDYSLDIIAPDLIVTAGPFTNMTTAQAKQAVESGRDYAFSDALWLNDTFERKYRDNRVRIIVDGKDSDWYWIYAREGASIGSLQLLSRSTRSQ